jgi:hypothetical protein
VRGGWLSSFWSWSCCFEESAEGGGEVEGGAVNPGGGAVGFLRMPFGLGLSGRFVSDAMVEDVAIWVS